MDWKKSEKNILRASKEVLKDLLLVLLRGFIFISTASVGHGGKRRIIVVKRDD
jgi:hypothetical protein